MKNRFFYTRIRKRTINGMVRYQAQYKLAGFFSFLLKWKTIKFGDTVRGPGIAAITDWTTHIEQAKTALFIQMMAESGVEMRITQRWEKKQTHNTK